MPQDANPQSPQSSSAIASSALTLYSGNVDGDGGQSPQTTSQTGSTQPPSTQSASPTSIIKRIDSTALEASANQLVDEVFEDIDYLLDGTPPPHPAAQAGAQGPSFTTNVFMPPAAEGSASAFNSMVMLWGLFPAIMAGLCLGLSIAFGILIGGRQATSTSNSSGSSNSGSSAMATASPEDEGFLTYLDQSLGGIVRQQPENDEPLAGVSVEKRDPLGPAKASSALAATPFSGANPLLLAPPVNVPTAASPPLLPLAPVQTAPIRLSAPPPAAPVQAVPQPLPATESPAPSSSAPNSAAPDPAAAPKDRVIPNISPSPHVLVGLLQLGDRSAAIFEFDDGARRIRIGDAIGSSGWSLVSISQDEAVIRRNGDVRSIYIGQRI